MPTVRIIWFSIWAAAEIVCLTPYMEPQHIIGIVLLVLFLLLTRRGLAAGFRATSPPRCHYAYTVLAVIATLGCWIAIWMLRNAKWFSGYYWVPALVGTGGLSVQTLLSLWPCARKPGAMPKRQRGHDGGIAAGD